MAEKVTLIPFCTLTKKKKKKMQERVHEGITNWITQFGIGIPKYLKSIRVVQSDRKNRQRIF